MGNWAGLGRATFGALVLGVALFGAHCSVALPLPPPEPQDPLWGYADLHAHPAFHLAYGAAVANTSDLAQSGIMYGLPGLAFDAGTEETDLAPCDGDSHGKDNPIANVLLTQLAKVLKTPHGKNGYPSFDNWPLATAGLHQQMHVTWLYRAWQGGQRLMVASVVENALLAAVFGGSLNPPAGTGIHDNERKAVDAQIDFIVNKLIANNTSWLALAKTSQEASDAITAGKMAIVLGTEFDTLDLQEMNELYDAGVRVFIPIHLADNDLGGTAVYEDIFNLHNAYVRGVGYHIAHDDFLSYALSLDIPPVKLFGLPLPDPFNKANVGIPPGHRNAQGLTTDLGKPMIHALIDKGAIIDVAHMGQQSIDDTLTIAKDEQVPVMDSHTSVRPKSELTKNERDLKYGDAQRIGALGGMIGISTGGNTQDTEVKAERTFYSTPFATITKAVPYHSDTFPSSAPPVACKSLLFSVWTANDDLREPATLKVNVNASPFDLNHGFTVANDRSLTVMVPLPENTKASDIDAELDHATNGDLLSARGPDQWNVGGVALACGPFAVHSDVPVTFDGNDPIASMTIDSTDAAMISAVPVDVWTSDALDDSHPLDIDVHTRSGTNTGCKDVLARGDGTREKLESSSIRHLVCPLPSAVAMSDIDAVSLHLRASASWKVQAWTVGFDDGSPSTATFVDKDFVPPLHVLDQAVTLALHGFPGEAMVRISITTGSSGLEPGIDAKATLHFRNDATPQVVRLNRNAPITAGRLDLVFNVSVPIPTTLQFYAPLVGHLSSDIDSIRIDAPNIQGEWPITGVVLEAFKEPALDWVENLAAVTDALGQSDCFAPNRFCGVALGTDLNGLAPTIPGTSVSPYDSTQPGKFFLDYPAELGGSGKIVGLSATGPTKTWDVMTDGIAHVGLLPDFLVAAAHVPRSDATQPSSARIVSTIFHSAGDFVRMWAKIEKKKK